MADNFPQLKKAYCPFSNVPEETQNYFHLLSCQNLEKGMQNGLLVTSTSACDIVAKEFWLNL
jgi:hypothetical protein